MGLGYKGPCAQRVYTLAPKYLNRDYFKANAYTSWAHGPLGYTTIVEVGPQTHCKDSLLGLARPCLSPPPPFFQHTHTKHTHTHHKTDIYKQSEANALIQSRPHLCVTYLLLSEAVQLLQVQPGRRASFKIIEGVLLDPSTSEGTP